MTLTKLSALVLTAAALLPSLGHAAPAATMTSAKRGGMGFAFDHQKIRGVNLGGWLVLEPWITPSIFEATPDNVMDEYSMSATLGKDEMEKRMQKHWSSWITAGDFSEMASLGLNFVRIPIGYWSVAPVDGDPYIQGAYEWLGKAIDWAGQNGIKVMIDLHGAPGSQNGFDNSGNKGVIQWTQGNTVSQTHKALKKLKKDHASNPAVASIELLNEPMGPELDMDTVEQFYYDSWGDLKNAPVATTIHDAFQDLSYWNGWGDGLWNVMVDTHHYEVFDSSELEMSTHDHISTACSYGGEMAGCNKWTVAGEWTGAMTDCAKWLNGRNTGARYDGTFEDSYFIGSCEGYSTGTVAGLSSDAKQNIGSFIHAQMAAYEKASGWIFWTWKTESAPEWDFQALAGAGIIPKLGSIDSSMCG
ncbi:uncharacterized protein LTR77_008674 [Saxophila tyrrhenica]|uniref:glucan 1,3-beta-glucosidase n=1 Tax=Saxophila tyrrhenica TaxID=1690608 RepID=A0AAV9P2R4_9PEZI|nr:hypothetical protein LTR77_008674 [Saxophila tyrrhenica]